MSTLAEQVENDYLYIDGVVTVTVTGNAAGTAVTKSAVKGLKRAITTNPNGTVHNETDGTRWHLWKSTLDGYEPQPGDMITYSGKSWIIGPVSLVTLDTRYQCECKEAR